MPPQKDKTKAELAISILSQCEGRLQKLDPASRKWVLDGLNAFHNGDAYMTVGGPLIEGSGTDAGDPEAIEPPQEPVAEQPEDEEGGANEAPEGV